MEVNELTIITDDKFNIQDVVILLIDLLELNVSKICSKIVDDWTFANEKNDSFENYDLENNKRNILVIEIYFYERKPIVIYVYFEKDHYVLDINTYNITNLINKNFIEKIISIFHNNYIAIALGDDYLLENSKNINNMIENSSGIEIWVINNNQEYISYEVIYKYEQNIDLFL